MEIESISKKVQDLGDIELAMLLSLIAKQHCIIHTQDESLDDAEEEIKMMLCLTQRKIASKVLGLASATITCTGSTTIEEFNRDLLIAEQFRRSQVLAEDPDSSKQEFLRASGKRRPDEDLMIANVVVAKNLSLSTRQVQMQALELLRTHRMFTHTGVYAVPKPFLVVILDSVSSAPLLKHLNDFIYISHYHESREAFPNPDSGSEWLDDDDGASTSSVLRRKPAEHTPSDPVLPPKEIEQLGARSEQVVVGVEIKRYMHDVLTFLRTHRAVAGGASPRASRHLELLVRGLALLHGLAFATPALVALAARKVYAHRLALVSTAGERSMQYGSDARAVASWLDGLTVDVVIEQVLLQVEVPL